MKSLINLKLIQRAVVLVWFAAAFSCLSGCKGWEVENRYGRTNFNYIPADERFETAIKRRDFDEAIRWADPRNSNRKINGEYPVVAAAKRGNHKAAFALIRKGADVRAVSGKGESLGYIAAKQGNEDVAREYIRLGGGRSDSLENGLIAYQEARKQQAWKNIFFILATQKFIDICLDAKNSESGAALSLFSKYYVRAPAIDNNLRIIYPDLSDSGIYFFRNILAKTVDGTLSAYSLSEGQFISESIAQAKRSGGINAAQERKLLFYSADLVRAIYKMN